MNDKLTRRDFLKIGSLSLGSFLVPVRLGQNFLGEEGEDEIFRIIVEPNFSMDIYHGETFLGVVADPSLQKILAQLVEHPKSPPSRALDLIPEFPSQNSAVLSSGLASAFTEGKQALLPLATY